MQMAQKNSAIPRRNALVCFCRRTHSRKLVWRHDEQKLISRFRQENEFLCLVPTPARRNRDSVFFVDGMPELSGIKAFGWRIVVHVSSGEFIHFAPLDPTFNHLLTARSIKISSPVAPTYLNPKPLRSINFSKEGMKMLGTLAFCAPQVDLAKPQSQTK